MATLTNDQNEDLGDSHFTFQILQGIGLAEAVGSRSSAPPGRGYSIRRGSNIPSELNGGPVDGEHGVSTVSVSDYFLHFFGRCLSDSWGQFLHNLKLVGDPFSEERK